MSSEVTVMGLNKDVEMRHLNAVGKDKQTNIRNMVKAFTHQDH